MILLRLAKREGGKTGRRFSGLTVIDEGRACCSYAPWLSRTAGGSRPGPALGQAGLTLGQVALNIAAVFYHVR